MGTAHLGRYQAKPGQALNPAGAPQRRRLSAAYDDLLSLPAELLDEAREAEALKRTEGTVADAIALGLARKAKAGVVAAATEIGDRTEGKSAVRQQGDSGLLAALFGAFCEFADDETGLLDAGALEAEGRLLEENESTPDTSATPAPAPVEEPQPKP